MVRPGTMAWLYLQQAERAGEGVAGWGCEEAAAGGGWRRLWLHGTTRRKMPLSLAHIASPIRVLSKHAQPAWHKELKLGWLRSHRHRGWLMVCKVATRDRHVWACRRLSNRVLDKTHAEPVLPSLLPDWSTRHCNAVVPFDQPFSHLPSPRRAVAAAITKGESVLAG